MLEQKVNLINEDECFLSFRSVLRDTVENRVEDYKHTDRHKLLAEVENVIADQVAVRVHVGGFCKSIQRTVGKQLDSEGDFLCLRLVLF